MPTFEESLTEAENVNVRIGMLLGNRYDDDRRLTLTLAYLNLSLDHHRAIIVLMRAGLFGSAMALVRLVFEAMIRSHWVAKCATDGQVQEVAENADFKFPTMGDMAKAVDVAFSIPNDEPLAFFHQAKADAWKATNSYTHSGLLQLARQFSGDRVEAAYPREDLQSGINAASASVLKQAHLVARITEQERLANQIEALFDFGEG